MARPTSTSESLRTIIAYVEGSSIFRVPETLPQEVLTKMSAPPKPDYPIFTVDIMPTYDAFLFGIPTRYGMMPAQWKVCRFRGLSEVYPG